jgi:hypothetical protein
MPITVKDAGASNVNVAILSDFQGQRTMANSIAVVLASDQSNVNVAVQGAVAVTGTFYQATQPVSGTFYQATQPVSGPLTNAELRGSSVQTVAGTKPTWVVSSGNMIHVAAARTTMLDIFNAAGSGAILKVRGVYIQPALVAVTGVGQTYELIRTNAVGTGGSTLTPAAYDTNSAGLNANITARSKPTGGATTNATVLYVNGSSEETVPYASLASVLNHVKGFDAQSTEPITLREGYGLKIDQTTNSNVGNVNMTVLFTVE